MFSNIYKCEISTKIWITLQNHFITESKIREGQLKTTLQTFKKGMMSISEYVKGMEMVGDALISNGQIVMEDELISYIIDGAGLEYDPIVVYIATKLDYPNESITLVKAKYALQKYKHRFVKNSMFLIDVQGSLVNMATQVGVLTMVVLIAMTCH